MKTAELSGAALDWAVAKCEGYIDDCNTWLHEATVSDVADGHFKPSTDWAQGGAIIEREGIEIKKGNPLYFPKGNEKGDYYEDLWIARKKQDGLPPGMQGVYEKWGTTPLQAAMRCYVASKLGDDVNVPEELQ